MTARRAAARQLVPRRRHGAACQECSSLHHKAHICQWQHAAWVPSACKLQCSGASTSPATSPYDETTRCADLIDHWHTNVTTAASSLDHNTSSAAQFMQHLVRALLFLGPSQHMQRHTTSNTKARCAQVVHGPGSSCVAQQDTSSSKASGNTRLQIQASTAEGSRECTPLLQDLWSAPNTSESLMLSALLAASVAAVCLTRRKAWQQQQL